MKRITFAITSKYEEIFLNYAVARIPKFITPDTLTLIALIAAIAGGSFYLFTNTTLLTLLGVNLCLIIHWIADSLDGRLARFRKISRPKYGYYIDHILDSFSAALFVGGLTTAAITDTAVWVWVLALILITMIHIFLKTNMLGTFNLSIQQVGPTEARLGLFFTNFIIFFAGNPRFFIFSIPVRLIDLAGFIAFIFLLTLLLPDIYKTAKLLSNVDRK
ncbi:CDP-alcohol phosphatidyltransferase family protein [Candidatus Gottesmanbacteria bacterium]|nr:CDP-alcohol phosphatidyltransferase family protein [Candidatus Gottesmanbacteria bacterium]